MIIELLAQFMDNGQPVGRPEAVIVCPKYFGGWDFTTAERDGQELRESGIAFSGQKCVPARWSDGDKGVDYLQHYDAELRCSVTAGTAYAASLTYQRTKVWYDPNIWNRGRQVKLLCRPVGELVS